MIRIQCPDRLTEDNCVEFANTLADRANAPDIVQLDFSGIKFARPGGTLLASQAIKSFVAHRKAQGLLTEANPYGLQVPSSTEAVGYLRFVGFFRYIGLHIENEPAVAPGSDSYMPITVLTRQDLCVAAGGGLLQDGVEARSEKLAGLVCAEKNKQRMLQYCFRETIRNVFEHARVNECAVMAQKYQSDEVEISIADAGIGIAQSLKGIYPFDSADEAVRGALRPGVTSAPRERRSGEWGNAGLGLYVLSQLGSALGSFSLTSSGIHLQLGVGEQRQLASGISGTTVTLRIRVQDDQQFADSVNRIVTAGDSEARSSRRQGQGSKSSRG